MFSKLYTCCVCRESDKAPDKGNWRKKEFILTHNSRNLSSMMKEVWRQEWEAVCCAEEPQNDESWGSVHISLFCYCSVCDVHVCGHIVCGGQRPSLEIWVSPSPLPRFQGLKWCQQACLIRVFSAEPSPFNSVQTLKPEALKPHSGWVFPCQLTPSGNPPQSCPEMLPWWF